MGGSVGATKNTQKKTPTEKKMRVRQKIQNLYKSAHWKNVGARGKKKSSAQPTLFLSNFGAPTIIIRLLRTGWGGVLRQYRTFAIFWVGFD